MDSVTYLIGVDGGGTSTRIAIADRAGNELARAQAGPSGLINGSKAAWEAILGALNAGFESLNQTMPDLPSMAIGIGLAGVHNKQWACDFAEKNPGFARLALETDAYTTLLGAHLGRPGVIVALGTGSVGEALWEDGTRREVGGWGFPSGDEASGAWLGLRAVNYAQQVLDQRAPSSDFALDVINHCGGNRDAMFAWTGQATQFSYASVAPIVFAHQTTSPVANDILVAAGKEVVKLVDALDMSAKLPIALCGSLAKPLECYLPDSILVRIVPAKGDAVTGALLLARPLLT